MPPFPILNDLESSLVRVLLVMGIALLLPTLFNRKSVWHRSAIFTVAGLLAVRYLWWRATFTIAPFGATWDCAASWSLLALEGLSVISSLSSFMILSRTKDRSAEATAHKDWWQPAPLPRVAILIATVRHQRPWDSLA